jgi:hypothetical protein
MKIQNSHGTLREDNFGELYKLQRQFIDSGFLTNRSRDPANNSSNLRQGKKDIFCGKINELQRQNSGNINHDSTDHI